MSRISFLLAISLLGSPALFAQHPNVLSPTYRINKLLPQPPFPYGPSVMRHVYGFDQVTNQGAGQVIGIIDAFDDPNAEADLAVFDRMWKLADCTTANGCFKKVLRHRESADG